MCVEGRRGVCRGHGEVCRGHIGVEQARHGVSRRQGEVCREVRGGERREQRAVCVGDRMGTIPSSLTSG